VIAYVDSSVIARIVMRQPDRLGSLHECERRLTSQLTQVECLRAIDGARLGEGLDQDEVLARRLILFQQLRRTSRVPIARPVLDRAGSSFPVSVKTLDAIHLATALLLRERRYPDLIFATHDRQQARAALALDFEVLGI
jgi:predicted nucleic acid-binding protein